MILDFDGGKGITFWESLFVQNKRTFYYTVNCKYFKCDEL